MPSLPESWQGGSVCFPFDYPASSQALELKQHFTTMPNVKKSSWRRNHGNKLIAIGVVAAAAMCAVQYFDLVPEVEIIQEPEAARPQLIGPQIKRSQLVVVVNGPNEYAGQPIRGSVSVYRPEGTLAAETSPVLTQGFELDKEGYATLAIDIPTITELTVSCYLDLNDNGVLDYSPSGLPLEPLRLSARPSSIPKSLNLEDELVTAPQSTMLIVHMVFPKEDIAADSMARANRRTNVGGSPKPPQ